MTPRTLSAAIGALTLPLLAAAQPASPPPADDTSVQLGRVDITGRDSGPLPPRRLLTSVDVIGGAPVQDAPVRSTWELFSRLPGVTLTDFNQGTTSGKLSLRGFNGEGEVNAVKLSLDGIPSNSNDGNMPYIDLAFPLAIERISVVRGTNDARFGLHNIAGNVDIATRSGGNATGARLGTGAWGLLDAQLARDIEQGEWSQNYFFGVRDSDGYRNHSAAQRTSVSGRWRWQPDGAGWRIGLIARRHEADAEEPGYLTAADARATPRRSYDLSATDGGRRRLDQLALEADGTLADTLSWQGVLYQNRFDDRRWVQFSAGVSQQERLTDEVHRGARVTLSWRPAQTLLEEFALEGGADAERQDNRSERYLSDRRVRQSQTRDQAWDFDVYGAFVQAVLRPVARLKLVPGLRLDALRGRFDDKLNAVRADINDYGVIRQPKFSAVWTPLPGWSAYGNWGRSFQVGVGAASYKVPPRTSDLSPSINDGWESGLKVQHGGWLESRIALWRQTASDEVYRDLNNPSGDSVNVGSTRRRGVDLHLRVQPAPGINAWATLTRQEARIVEPNPAAPGTRGKELDHVPRRLFTLGVDWQVHEALRLSTWANGQGDYFLERSNTAGRFGGYALLNAGATWIISPALQFDVQVKNLTDRYREYVWWDGTQSLHSPGEGRGAFASLRFAL